jgi:tight adherence protein B
MSLELAGGGNVSTLLLASACATAAAVFCLAWSLQQSFSATRRAVRSRTLSTSNQAGSDLQPVKRRWQNILPISESARKTTLELQQAGWLIKVNEFHLLRFFFALVCMFAGLFGLKQLGSTTLLVTVPVVLLCGLVGSSLPTRYARGRRAARMAAIEKALPEVLSSMAKALRAGAGLLQALSYASDEAPPPLGPEIARTLRDLHLGVAPEAAFDDLSKRVGSNDLDIALTAMMIQRTVGGNLSEILINVCNTIRERQTIKAEVGVLTSRQKLTGNLVAMLPVVLAVFYLAANSNVAGLLFTTTAGNISLVVGIFFELLGLMIIRRLAVIEY